MTSISVIIPAYNARNTICNTVEAILNQKYLEYNYEVIVVDDGSTDNTVDLLKNYPDIITITQKNSGPAAARNVGAFHSTGEILVFTDSDTVPHPNWLYELTKPFENNSIYAATGTYSIENPDSKLAQLIQTEIRQKHNKYGEFVLFGGSYNLAIRKDLFNDIGGFNEEYRKASGEDNDISYKILSAGHKIKYIPTAIVGHYHPEKLIKYLRTQYTHGYWRAKLYYSFPQRATGDSYTGSKEALETIFTTAIIVLPIFSIVFKIIGYERIKRISHILCLSSMLGIISLELKSSLQLKDTSNEDIYMKLPSLAETVLIFILRTFCRTVGFFAGLIAFAPDFRKWISSK